MSENNEIDETGQDHHQHDGIASPVLHIAGVPRIQTLLEQYAVCSALLDIVEGVEVKIGAQKGHLSRIESLCFTKHAYSGLRPSGSKTDDDSQSKDNTFAHTAAVLVQLETTRQAQAVCRRYSSRHSQPPSIIWHDEMFSLKIDYAYKHALTRPQTTSTFSTCSKHRDERSCSLSSCPKRWYLNLNDVDVRAQIHTAAERCSAVCAVQFASAHRRRRRRKRAQSCRSSSRSGAQEDYEVAKEAERVDEDDAVTSAKQTPVVAETKRSAQPQAKVKRSDLPSAQVKKWQPKEVLGDARTSAVNHQDEAIVSGEERNNDEAGLCSILNILADYQANANAELLVRPFMFDVCGLATVTTPTSRP